MQTEQPLEMGGGGSGSSSSSSTAKKITLNYDFSKSAVYGTKNFKSDTSKSARSIDGEAADASESLVKITETGEAEAVIAVEPEAKKNLKPVVDILKAPNTTKTSGVYTVFEGTMFFDDNTYASQIQYSYEKDGKTETVDVLGEAGKSIYVETWRKDWQDLDYMQFTNDETVYFFGTDSKVDKPAHIIYQYNPKSTDFKCAKPFFTLPENEEFCNFTVAKDGSYIFVITGRDHREIEYTNPQTQKTEKNWFEKIKVYSIDKAGTAKVLFEDKYDSWADLHPIMIDSNTNKLYWFVIGWFEDNFNISSGLYISDRTSNGYTSYERYMNPGIYGIEQYIKNKATKEDKSIDYQKVIDYFAAFVPGYTSDMTFTLKNFKDLKIKKKNTLSEEDFGKYLYGTDSNDEPLTGVKAMEYLFTTYEPGNTDDNGNKVPIIYSWWAGLYALSNTEKYNYIPFELFFVKKDGSPVTLDTNHEKYFQSDYKSITGDFLISNDDGVWCLMRDGENGTDGKYHLTHTKIVRLTDKNGNVVNDMPNGLQAARFAPRTWRQSDEDLPFRTPFTTTAKGIAGIAENKKSILYSHDGTTENLLKNYESVSNIATIHAFTMDEKSLLLNATTTGGGHITLKQDLATGEVTKLKFSAALKSILQVEATETGSSPEDKRAENTFAVTIEAPADIKIDQATSDTGITLTVSLDGKEFESARYSWSIMGKEISNTNKLELNKASYTTGSYPILVEVTSDGKAYAAFVHVDIK